MRLTFFLLSIVLVSCSQDRSTIDAAQIAEAARTLSSAEWRIAQFIEDGDDYTRKFENYRFRFAQDSTLTLIAPGGATATSGRWRFFEDDGRTEFEITRFRGDKYEDFNDDWYVISLSASEMRFEDNDGPRRELLRLERIP